MSIDVNLVTTLIEYAGSFAFAISGVRHAATKHFDWFGGYVCGIAVVIGGGTIRDVMLGVTPFWMTTPAYLICMTLAFICAVVFSSEPKKMSHTFLVFDTLGLALFTIVGIQKTLMLGHPYWVAIVMGCITGAAGGVIRDILLNNEPVIFRKEIYAMACVAGGVVYTVLMKLGVDMPISSLCCFVFICLTRFLAIKYNISLPKLKNTTT